MLPILLAGVAWADCSVPTDTAELATSIAEAEAAFSAMDSAAFSAAAGRVDATLPCLDEVLPPADAAAVHRVDAYHALLDGDEAALEARLWATVAILPAWTPPSHLAPPGHPLHDAWQSAKKRVAVPGVPLEPPEHGVIHVDGVRREARPSDRPTVLQLVRDDGSIAWTARIRLGEEPPYWVPAAPAPDPVATPHLAPAAPIGPTPPTTTDIPGKTGPSPTATGLLAAAGCAALASGALFGLATASRHTFDDPATPYSELDGLRGRTNALTIGSGSTGAVAIGVGIAAVAVW